MPGYPIEIDLRGRRVLVVGLGAVGRRKAVGLAEAGAVVRGVDPVGAGADGWPDRPGSVEVRAEEYRQEHLEGALLAFAAATDVVNRRVVADAKAAGILVNAAGEPAAGDFALPAAWRDGPIGLTVSTSGASPALAAALRDRAAGSLGPEAAALAGLLATLRPVVLARLADPAARRRVLASWGDPALLALWRDAGEEAVRRLLLSRIEAEAG